MRGVLPHYISGEIVGGVIAVVVRMRPATQGEGRGLRGKRLWEKG